MKGYCFLILAVAFLMYFQKDPIFTVIILGIGVAVYLFFKARKNGKGLTGLFGGSSAGQQDKMNDLMTLIVFQQLISNSSGSNAKSTSQPQSNKDNALVSKESSSNRTALEQEILELFDKYDSSKSNKR